MPKAAIPKTLRNAIQHHHAGRLSQAEALYREVLARDPGCVDALHYLGVIAHQVGQPAVAVEMFLQAAGLAPGNPEIHFHLGDAYRRLQRLEEAGASYRQALALRPDFPDAWNNRGIALAALGRSDEALGCFRQALALQPKAANFHYNLGLALIDQGQFPEAVDCLQRTLALQPDFANAHNDLSNLLKVGLASKPEPARIYNNLGCVLLDRGRLDDALACLQQALALDPDLAEAHNNLGNVLLAHRELDRALASFRQALTLKPDFADALGNLGNALFARGRLDEALACFRQALELKPNSSEIRCNLGSVLAQRGRLDEAFGCFRQALTLKPDFADAHNNIGSLLKERGQLDEALVAYQRALALQPNFAEAYNNLGNLLLDRRQLDEALACFRQAHDLLPDRPDFQSNIILALQYRPNHEAEKVAAAVRDWNRRYARPLSRQILSHPHDRSPERRLRLGYVSHDFRLHAVAFFLLPLLQAHDRGRIHVTAYSTNATADEVTARFQSCTDAWVSLVGLSDEEAAQRIREDRIDILVDLGGHFAGNRLPVFARKPAPIQVSYLGYPASTGLDSMDYRLTDALADPPEAIAEAQPEQLMRLPETAWCFSPLSGSPQVNEPPALQSGHVTFGCFNNSTKVTDAMLELWARILQRVPGSQFALKNQAMATPSIVHRLKAVFAHGAISADRLELIPHQASTLAHLQCYDRVDLALDTFPYHGTTTTCEALWMGVPVLTLAGNRHRSRVGVSLLTNAGLPEFVTTSPEAYLDAAVAAARDLPRLAAARRSLRERMQRSVLMDAPRFARAVETAFRTMWHRWCSQPATANDQNR
ncbi:MAG: tetratricopeptide repeat protein [Verrucomicrobia bacterium]|nr:tetratricopeptide repeat protein [Verrucomicrobiota bacterium]